MPKFVKLPNGALIDLDNVAFVLHADLNKYVLIPKQSISPNVPQLDGENFDALCAHLEESGQMTALKAASKIAA